MQNESVDLARSARATSKARAAATRVIAWSWPRVRQIRTWPGAIRRWMDAYPTRATAVTAVLCTVFFFAIPDYYTMQARIPPFEQLKRSEGVLEFTQHYKTGVSTHLHTDRGRLTFSCAVPNGTSNSCIRDERPYAGRQAVIWWYDMPSYPFASISYAVRIDVEGTTVRSYTRSVERLESFQADGWIMTWIVSVAFGLWTSITYFYQRWKGSKQS